MSNPTCHDPEAGCTFSAAGLEGDCTGTAGILSYSEIQSRNFTLNVETYYDPETTVKYATYLGSQWVSYDDVQSFADKKRFLFSRCLGGLMIWAVDQDTQDYQALTGLLGEDAISQSLIEGRNLDDDDKEALSNAFAPFNGQNCFVTTLCTDGSDAESGPEQVCPSGTSSVKTAHNPLQAPGHDIIGKCDKGWYRHICCPSKQMPENCEWTGAPERQVIGCDGKCGRNQFELNQDTYLNSEGGGVCGFGHRSLCCDSTELLSDSGDDSDCIWTGCGGPVNEEDNLECPSSHPNAITSRFDQDNGEWCAATYNNGAGSPVLRSFKRTFCCKPSAERENCKWSNEDFDPEDPSSYRPCTPGTCRKTKTKVTEALEPLAGFFNRHPDQLYSFENPRIISADCSGSALPVEYMMEYPLCCDPPSEYTERWPVDPAYLWENAYTSDDADVAWSYADNFQNNNQDNQADYVTGDPDSDDYGEDAYGFLMLDGPASSLDNEFSDEFTVTRRSETPPVRKRSILTANRTLLDTTFEHAEETVHMYCNYPAGSDQCNKVFLGGAEDTVIKLPDHVGEGPFARIVSMQPADPDYRLPGHHLRSRSLNELNTPVWKMTFDYNFHLIKRDDGDVNLRVDYTNLLGYWDELTDEPARRKRSAAHDDYGSWRSKVDDAKKKHETIRRTANEKRSRHNQTVELEKEADSSAVGHRPQKRWYGAFLNWLERLTTVRTSDIGFLFMGIQKKFLLYEASTPCQRAQVSARMQLFMNTDISMDATYAYYLQGTFLPPSRAGITKTYAYFGLDPHAMVELQAVGNARMQYTSQRRKLIDTLTYPGLSIKGVATIGPTLDILGQIKGSITLDGEVKAGARLNFGKAEVYYPQVDDAAQYTELNDLLSDAQRPARDLLEPIFEAGVEAMADLRVLVEPVVSLGLVVGSDRFGGTIMDAHISGFVNTTLVFQANAGASYTLDDGEIGWYYSYGVFFLYNVGYRAQAGVALAGVPGWSSNIRYAYDTPKNFSILPTTRFESSPSQGSSQKRSLAPLIKAPRRGLLNGDDATGLEPVRNHMRRHSLSSKHTHHRHHAHNAPDRQNSHMHNTSSADVDFLLGKRATAGPSNSNLPGQAQIAGNPSYINCAGSSNQLPEYRYNCAIFGDIQANNNGASTISPGICFGIRNWFDRIGMAYEGLQLTWDNDAGRARVRRDASCPDPPGSTYCRREVTNLANTLGTTFARAPVTCDEFPFARTEEGGNYMANRQNNPNPSSASCTPQWQQQIQSSCNGIMSHLQTNVGTSSAPNWKTWNDAGWLSTNNNWQTTTTYNTEIPKAAGITDTAYSAGNGVYGGYTWRRAFTFGLATPSGPADGAAWGTQALQSWTLKSSGSTSTDAAQVVCAVNLFGQTDNYQFDYQKYNGFCFNGNQPTQFPWGQYPSFSRCQINFAGANFPTKRSVGSFGDWEIESIEMDPDPVMFLPEDFQMPEDQPSMPFKYAEPGSK